MAVYRVPQDVEADDKLIGPFTFRQFIYLIIAIGGIALGWFLGRLFLPFAIITFPIIILFGALALPLKKDQPMEVYLTAVVSFYLKPKKRLWKTDGIQSLVEVLSPKTIEINRTKDISEAEAQKRLSYLADIVDTKGWSIRGVSAPADTPLRQDTYYEAQQAQDILDDAGRTSTLFGDMLTQSDRKRREEAVSILKNNNVEQDNKVRSTSTNIISQPINDFQQPAVIYNPYPSMKQSVIAPPAEDQQYRTVSSEQANSPQAHTYTSEQTVSPDIINLARNTDLTIETISREANRIKERNLSEEVVISLR